ncbi:MAG: glycolate oxidase subunit GlcE [Paucibacter sp.]|nr:glycolate oxidase subunit GlcE [Roseateles sp.]
MYDELQEQRREARAQGTTLIPMGAGSKRDWLPPREGKTLSLAGISGIIDYQPSELVIRARAGTPLREIETTLAERNQMLASEPPNLDGRSTLGGAVACGWSGPRRPWAGALRDQVLGVTMLNGTGELLRFGGSVIKNVAGFDVSRLMTGSMGTLGVILEANLKVVPRPPVDIVLALECGQAEGIRRANQASASAIPLAGAAWEAGVLRLRLSGAAAGVAVGRDILGGEEDHDGLAWFDALRHFRHAFFGQPAPGMILWRLSLPQAAPPLLVGYPQLVDWAGGQRWLLAHAEASSIVQAAASAAGGNASIRRVGTPWPQHSPLTPTIAALQQRLKRAFDPAGLFGNHLPPFA